MSSGGGFEVTPEALHALQAQMERLLSHAEQVAGQATSVVGSAGATGMAKVDHALDGFNQGLWQQAGQLNRAGGELYGAVGKSAQSYQQTEQHLAREIDQETNQGGSG